jgi:hypothetical protein
VSGGIQLGTPSTPQPVLGSGSTLGGSPPVSVRSTADGPFVLAPIEFGNTATQNDNLRLISQGGLPPKDSGSNVTYDPATRSLTVGNNGIVTLGGATYNFCKITLGNGARIKNASGTLANPHYIRIFLDSPDRAGSGCIPASMNGDAALARAAGFGGMSLGENSLFENPAPGHAVQFQLYMYGYHDQSHTVEFFNSVAMNIAIYAPTSTLVWKNAAGITGAVAASKVEFKNTADFAWAGDSGGFSLSDLRADTVSIYYRMAWRECPRNRTVASDPESGC